MAKFSGWKRAYYHDERAESNLLGIQAWELDISSDTIFHCFNEADCGMETPVEESLPLVEIQRGIQRNIQLLEQKGSITAIRRRKMPSGGKKKCLLI